MELVLYEKYSSVLELKNVEEIKDLIYSREKAILPHNADNKQIGYATYSINTSIRSIGTLLQNEHPFILNTGKIYNAYYYDFKSLRNSIQSSKIRIPGVTLAQAKKDRIIKYQNVQDTISGIRTPINLDILQGRNFIYDLQPVNDMLIANPKLSKLTLNDKLSMYFNTINHFMNLPVYINQEKMISYGKGPILVDLDEYKGNDDINKYHILTMLSILLRRRDEFMTQFNSSYTILFYTKNGYIVFDMAKDLSKQNLAKFKLLLTRLKPDVKVDQVADIVLKDEIASKLGTKFGFTGDDETIPSDSDIVSTVSDKIEDPDDIDDDPDISDELEKELDSNPEMKKQYLDAVVQKRTGKKSEVSLQRDNLLRDRQKDIVIKSKTIGELLKDTKIPMLDERVVNTSPTTNENMKKVKFYEFEKTYNDGLLERDIAKVITSFNDKTINVNVVDVKVTDISDNLNMKEQYTIQFEDENRKRHTMTINLPKFIDERFLYLNGNKKSIQKQFMGMPIIKTGPDEVQICSNYNKIFIRRYGTKFNPNVEKFKKFIVDPKNDVTIVRGDSSKINLKYLTCLEYDKLSTTYTSITIGDCTFVFNAQMLTEIFKDKYKSDLDKILIGYKTKGTTKEPIFYDRKNEDHVDLISTMILNSKPEAYDDFKRLSFGKKYIHTKATLLGKDVPVVVLLSFFEGLSSVVRKFNSPDVKFTDKKSNQDNYMYIPFDDGYLSYPMSNMEACMLFNGFTEVPTSQFTIAEMDESEPYISIFEFLFGSAYIAGGLLNYYDFMIDPITLEILQILNYPTDIVSLVIYANNMLADNSFKSDMDLSLYRLRDNEIIPALMYKQMTVAYSRYRKTANNNNPVKLTVDPDCIIKALNDIPTVEDYSRLSPIVEVRQNGIASMKGYVGMNLDRAYKQDKRVFDDSMLGVIGVSTDIAANCGKERHLVVEPSVINARGMMSLNNRENPGLLNDVNLETGVEMLNPGVLRHDDPARNAMASKQSGHVIPVEKQSPLLVTNGMDSMIHYRTCDDFSVVAKEDGVVEDYDTTTHIMVVKYKSGKKKAIDLSVQIAKNGGGGMYLKNQLITSFKKGDTFKKDAILAFDKNFYKDTGVFGNRLTFGTLVKSAIVSNYATYEDSMWATKKLSEEMATNITMEKKVVIGKNANVDFIVKKGDTVNIGDELIRFETAYDNAEMNNLLSSIRADLQEEIVNLGKTKVGAKYTGEVTDIVVYPTISREEMSPTLRKVVDNIQKEVKDKKKFLDKHDPDNKESVYRMGILMTKPDDIIEPDRYGKVQGEDAADSVVFKFFITYHDELSDGDKLTHMTANKATIGYVVPRGFEPYTEFRPYEEISIPLAPSAILQRGTPSIEPTMLNYKILIELKRAGYEILTGEKWNDKQKRENTYMLKPENVTESIDMSTNQIDVGVLETLNEVFDMKISSDGHYLSGSLYGPDDLIMCSETENLECILNRFTHDDNCSPTVKYDKDTNSIIALETIYVGERFYI